MKHFHNYTLPRCDSNYPFEDGKRLTGFAAGLKSKTTQRKRQRGRQSNEGAKRRREKKKRKEKARERKKARENLSKKTMC